MYIVSLQTRASALIYYNKTEINREKLLMYYLPSYYYTLERVIEQKFNDKLTWNQVFICKMRPLTEEEAKGTLDACFTLYECNEWLLVNVHEITKLLFCTSTEVLFQKLSEYMGRSIEHLINRSDERHCFRLGAKDRVYYVSETVMKACTTISRDSLLSCGACMGKFTKSGKFRLHITALDYLSQYAQVSLWIHSLCDYKQTIKIYLILCYFSTLKQTVQSVGETVGRNVFFVRK